MIRCQTHSGSYYYLTENAHGFAWAATPNTAKRMTRHQSRKVMRRLIDRFPTLLPELIRTKS